jgi:hypothetical protein
MRKEGSGTKGKIVIITIFGPFVFFLRSVFNGSHKLKKKKVVAGCPQVFLIPLTSLPFFSFIILGFFFLTCPLECRRPKLPYDKTEIKLIGNQ